MRNKKIMILISILLMIMGVSLVSYACYFWHDEGTTCSGTALASSIAANTATVSPEQ